MSEFEMYDEMFTQVAARSGGIKPLLDAFFSFMERKTDFYVEFDRADPQAASYRMGFPKGVAEKMVLDAFRKYHMKDYATAAVQLGVPSPTGTPAKTNEGTTVRQTSSRKSTSKTTNAKSPSTNEAVVSGGSKSDTPVSTPAKITGALTTPQTPQTTSEGKQIPIGNGGVGLGYYWTQTLKDLTVYIDLPEHCQGCRSKDIVCSIKPQSLRVGIKKNQKDGTEIIIDGDLEDIVRVDESMWTLSRTTDVAAAQIVITLDKTRKTWWKHIIKGHPEIDTSKVDSTQNISEYDETTQATIRKIMFEQQQKRLSESSDSLDRLARNMSPEYISPSRVDDNISDNKGGGGATNCIDDLLARAAAAPGSPL